MTTQSQSSYDYSVYWQPGCSSCLRTKEFLTKHGIQYNSINVQEDNDAFDNLSRLGARSIPVVTRGEEFVYAQDIDVLADFLGIPQTRQVLTFEVLLEKLDLLLLAAQRYLRQMPDELMSNSLPGRDRNYSDLAYHIFVIPLAFLDAVSGQELSYAYFERRPPKSISTISGLISYGDEIRKKLESWQVSTTQTTMPDSVLTYYGQHSTHSVLERTAWHTAQHVRQLMELLDKHKIEVDEPLGDRELAGLPLPDEVYDDEIDL
ncbi:MAG: hypothetical protein GKR93_11325 [Gammaproteobacteria bacterium]|nr:hypothetical protein [Gammaproteobacteria bacterium]